MISDFFLRDETGLETVTLPVCRNDNCCNGFECLDGNSVPLAMSYTPMQQFNNIYTPAEALKAGTLFADLDKPFLGARIGR